VEGAGAYVVVMFVLSATAYAFFQVPYAAMPAEMTDSYSERTRMMTWRVALLATAILVSGAGAPYILDRAGGGIPGHRWMALFVAALIVIGTLIAFYSTANTVTGAVTASAPSLLAQLRVAVANRPFRLLVMCVVAQTTGVACMLTGVRYFAVYVMDDPASTTLMFLAVVSPALFTTPIWRRFGERTSKLRGYVVGSITLTAATLALTAAPYLPHLVIYAVIALMGFGYAGQQLFGLSMLPDCIAADTLRTGKRQAGVFTGVWTAGEALGLALGPTIYGNVLSLFEYVSSNTGGFLPQTSLAEHGVLLGFTLVPGLIVGVALLLLRGYDVEKVGSAV